MATATAATGEHHHRNITGGTPRATLLGMSDGLLTNVGLILGMAGANPAASVVRLAGVAGLIAGAISMGVNEFLSLNAQVELAEHELRLERNEIVHRPVKERAELVALYVKRGVREEVAEEVATALMADTDQALEIHAKEELGIDPDNLGSPLAAAFASFGAFIVGALLPLMPWLFGDSSDGKVVASMVLGAGGVILIGVVLARLTNRAPWRIAARWLVLAAGAAAISYAVGSVVGVSTPV
jgi:VIT1/CCC1 family predicted Fe2+/Mn2+ transporter